MKHKTKYITNDKIDKNHIISLSYIKVLSLIL